MDPVLVFTVLISVILLAPLLAERLRVPDLILLLLAGMILGPHATGFLENDKAIELFSSVGILYIMFLAGLEIDLHRFARSRNRSIAFGLMTFLIPQGIGMLIGHYILRLSWPASALMASMFASHTLLTYPIVSRLGISKSEPVAITVGATIITDTLALLVLAVVADSARGISLDWVFWLSIVLGMAALSSLALWGIPWLSRWFFHHVPEKGGAQFLFVIAVLCGCSYLSHFAKMEPIIGAFLAGVAFNRLIPAQSALMSRVEFAGHSLFIPFFLISVGMLVDPSVLASDPRTWLVAASMVVAVVGTKWAAAFLARHWFGYSRDEGNVMFGLSVVQAAATLAAVLVGYRLKIVDVSVLNGAIAMIMVTCPLGSWMVDRYGRRMAAGGPERVAPVRADQRLLVSVANPASATELLDLAFLLRNPDRPGAIHPVAFVPDEGETADAVANGEKLLSLCLAHAAAADAEVHPSVRVGLNASDGLVRAAKELRADTVMVGWTGARSASSRLFGTLFDQLVEESPSRVLLCRLVKPLNTAKRLLLPLPPLAERRADIMALLEDVKWLARQIGVELHVHLATESSESNLPQMLKSTKPSVPTTLVTASSWRKALAGLFESIGPDDLIWLPVERRQSVLWFPSLDRLPETVALRFPNVNLLAAYPPNTNLEEAMAEEAAERPSTIALLPIGHRLNALNIDEALQQITSRVKAWSPKQQQEVLSLLLDAVHSYPVEMAPGTVLLHAHSEAVDAPLVLIGVAQNPWPLPDEEGNARVVLSLISPRDRAPEIHLRALADLARCFHKKTVTRQVTEAESADAVEHILRQAMLASQAAEHLPDNETPATSS